MADHLSPLEDQDDAESWLVTYADAVTLLMAFFVMIVSFSKVDMPLYEKVAAGIRGEVGRHEVAVTTDAIKTEVRQTVFAMQADQAVHVGEDERGVVIELASSSFYKPGSAELEDAAYPVLRQIALTLMAPQFQFFNVEITGHTDDDPISTEMFPSNWELSAARATRVARLFIETGMVPLRLHAKAYGDTRPKVPNRDLDGEPIEANKALNRRVEIRVYPMSMDEKNAFYAYRAAEELGRPGDGMRRETSWPAPSPTMTPPAAREAEETPEETAPTPPATNATPPVPFLTPLSSPAAP